MVTIDRLPDAAIYTGTVRHRRFTPVEHIFEYPLFMVLLDIDRIPALMQRSRLTAHNRFNWASFHDDDHLRAPGLTPGTTMRERLTAAASSRGITLPPGRVLLLTHLRYLGYVFNPVSFFYGFTDEGTLDWVVAEVNNTSGGSHLYWLDRETLERRGSSLRGSASKRLHVSPFMTADLEYVFGLTRPGDHLTVHIDAVRDGDRIFDATLSLDRREWTPRAVRQTLLRHPWMTAKVIGAIHWEALRLWRKGVPVIGEGGRARKGGTGGRGWRGGKAGASA